MLLLPPDYLGDGRVSGIVWHRVFFGLGYDPAWPFGNLRRSRAPRLVGTKADRWGKPSSRLGPAIMPSRRIANVD